MCSDPVTRLANSVHRHDQSIGLWIHDSDTAWPPDWNEAALRFAGSTSVVVYVEEHSLRVLAVHLAKGWRKYHLSDVAGKCADQWVSLRSQWPRGLRRRSAAAHLLRLWVRIPPGAWISVFCECCVLSGRGLCYDLITHREEYYRLWCVVVCDLETSWMRRPWPTGGLSRQKKMSWSPVTPHDMFTEKWCW